MDKQAIATWYDESSPLYRYFWYLNSDSFALHYGFWDNKTKHIGDAFQNTNKVMAVFDKTHEILPSAKRFSLICRFMYPFIIIAAILHIVPNIFIAGCKAGIVQYEAVQAGVGGYGIMYGEK